MKAKEKKASSGIPKLKTVLIPEKILAPKFFPFSQNPPLSPPPPALIKTKNKKKTKNHKEICRTFIYVNYVNDKIVRYIEREKQKFFRYRGNRGSIIDLINFTK